MPKFKTIKKLIKKFRKKIKERAKHRQLITYDEEDHQYLTVQFADGQTFNLGVFQSNFRKRLIKKLPDYNITRIHSGCIAPHKIKFYDCKTGVNTHLFACENPVTGYHPVNYELLDEAITNNCLPFQPLVQDMHWSVVGAAFISPIVLVFLGMWLFQLYHNYVMRQDARETQRQESLRYLQRSFTRALHDGNKNAIQDDYLATPEALFRKKNA